MRVGLKVGAIEGPYDGKLVGVRVGLKVGVIEGPYDGKLDGMLVGWPTGSGCVHVSLRDCINKLVYGLAPLA